MSSNKTYVIMKNGVKIKTTKSFNNAKAVAEAEQAEVFCNGELVYEAASSVAEETHTATSGSEEQNDVQSGEQSDVQNEEQRKEQPDATSGAIRTDPIGEEKLPEPEETEQLKAYRIKALMNVREAPSLTAKIVAVVEAGKIMNVYEIKHDWMKVKWYEEFAYILYKNGEFAEPARG